MGHGTCNVTYTTKKYCSAALAFLLLLAALIVPGMVRSHYGMSQWRRVPISISSIQVEKSITGKHNQAVYVIAIEYAYKVDGIRYLSDKLSPFVTHYRSVEEAEQAVATVRSESKAFVNPRDPSDSYVVNNSGNFATVLRIGLIVISAFLAVVALAYQFGRGE